MTVPFSESYPDIKAMTPAQRMGRAATLAKLAEGNMMGLCALDFKNMADTEAANAAAAAEHAARQRAAEAETTAAWATRKAREWGLPVPQAA